MYINSWILHPPGGSKAQGKGDSRNHGCSDPFVCVFLAPRDGARALFLKGSEELAYTTLRVSNQRRKAQNLQPAYTWLFL